MVGSAFRPTTTDDGVDDSAASFSFWASVAAVIDVDLSPGNGAGPDPEAVAEGARAEGRGEMSAEMPPPLPTEGTAAGAGGLCESVSALDACDSSMADMAATKTT